MAYILTPEVLANMLGEKDIPRVAQIMKLTLSSLAYLKVEGELSCEGIRITKISPTVLSVDVQIVPEELADALEGQELIRVPV